LTYQEPSNLTYQELSIMGSRFDPFGTKVWPFRNQSLTLSEPKWGFSLFLLMCWWVR